MRKWNPYLISWVGYIWTNKNVLGRGVNKLYCRKYLWFGWKIASLKDAKTYASRTKVTNLTLSISRTSVQQTCYRLLFFFFFVWEDIFLKSRTNHGSLSREEECLTLNQNYEETGMKINRKIVKGEKKEESEAQTTSKYIEMVKLTRCQRNAR